jgi:hypothetical protein
LKEWMLMIYYKGLKEELWDLFIEFHPTIMKC